MKFTMQRVADLRCPEGKKDILAFDDEMPGLGIRVSAGGSKRWIVQYRTAQGAIRRTSLGKVEVISLAEARRQAKEILGKVAAGADPVEDRRAAEAEAERKRQAEKFTLDALIDAWAADRADSRSAAYLKIATQAMRRHLKPLLDLPAASLTTQQAVAALDDAKRDAGPVAANRLLSYARATYSWACKRQRLTSNPFVGLERPSRETSRERVLNDHEIGAIWRAASAADWPAGPYVRMLMLTLARRDEIAGMKWSEISEDGSAWTLPATRSKNHRAHVVKLPRQAREILASLPRFEGCDFVFSTTGRSPVSGFRGFKARIDKHLHDAGDAVAPWVLHDFRRSGVTKLADLGIPPHIADKLLNHKSGAIQGVAAVYQRAEFLPERERALQAWADHIEASADGREAAGNVVALRSA